MSDSGSRLLGMLLRWRQFKQTHRQTDKLIKSLEQNSMCPIPTSTSTCTQVLQFKRPRSLLVSCLVSCTCEASGGLLRVGGARAAAAQKKKPRLRQSISVNCVKTALQVMKPRGLAEQNSPASVPRRGQTVITSAARPLAPPSAERHYDNPHK